MITIEQYFGKYLNHKDATAVMKQNAEHLLSICVALETHLVSLGVSFPVNPKTRSQVSGETYGGFRPQDCPIGASGSAHKRGLAVDRYDPTGKIDQCLLEHPELLVKYGVYIEHPSKTLGWSHWSILPPRSGKHIFYP